MKSVFLTLAEGGAVVGVSRSREGAIRQAVAEGADEVVESHQYLGDSEDGMTPNAGNPKRAHAFMGNLRVNWRESQAMSLEEALARVQPHFPAYKAEGGRAKPVRLYSDPMEFTDSLLGGNVKTSKTGEGAIPGGGKVDIVGLSLLPHWLWHDAVGGMLGEKRRITLCAYSTDECRQSCLVYSGSNNNDVYNAVVKLARTNALMTEPEAFVRLLEIAALRHLSKRGSFIRHVRLNMFSDIPWELVCPELLQSCHSATLATRSKAADLYDKDPEAAFYDYTKIPGREFLPGYDLTFSFSGANAKDCLNELENGRRVAVVFIDPEIPHASSKGAERFRLPPAVRIYGNEVPVIGGDTYDARPHDPGSVVVGLKYKTPQATGGFYQKEKEELFHTVYGKGYEGIVRAKDMIKPRRIERDKNVAFLVHAYETDDGAIITAVTPGAQPGVQKEQSDLLVTGDEVPGEQELLDVLGE